MGANPFAPPSKAANADEALPASARDSQASARKSPKSPKPAAAPATEEPAEEEEPTAAAKPKGATPRKGSPSPRIKGISLTPRKVISVEDSRSIAVRMKCFYLDQVEGRPLRWGEGILF